MPKVVLLSLASVLLAASAHPALRAGYDEKVVKEKGGGEEIFSDGSGIVSGIDTTHAPVGAGFEGIGVKAKVREGKIEGSANGAWCPAGMYGSNDLERGPRAYIEKEAGIQGGCHVCPDGKYSKLGSKACKKNPCKTDYYLRISEAATVIVHGVTIRGGAMQCVQCPQGKTSNPASDAPPACSGDWHSYSCNNEVSESMQDCVARYNRPVSSALHHSIVGHTKLHYHHHASERCGDAIKKHCTQLVGEYDDFDYMGCRACAAKHKFQSCLWKRDEIEYVCEKMESQVTAAKDRFSRGVEYIPAYLVPQKRCDGCEGFESWGAEVGACFIARTVDVLNVMYGLTHCSTFKKRNRDHPCSPYLADDLIKNLRMCCHGNTKLVLHKGEMMCKEQLLKVLDSAERVVKPAFDQCVDNPGASVCKARKQAFFKCKHSGRYPTDTSDCDDAFDSVKPTFTAILSAARQMYKEAPAADTSPLASIMLDMCTSTWEAEYLGLPPGCKKNKPCSFTPIMRDCQEHMFTAMKKLRHKECDDPLDPQYDC